MIRAEQGRGQSVQAVIAACLAAGAAAVGVLAHSPSSDAAFVRPNVIVVSTDDQALSWFSRKTMPQTWRELVKRGTRFENAIVTTPLCCPARAAFLTGQYGHNNGVQRNRYKDLLDPGNVLPAWLQRAGYTTAHIGKWLNDYDVTVEDPAKPAPGWDYWRTSVGNPVYYDGKLSIDGEVREYGHDPEDLLTRQVGRQSVNLVRRLAAEEKPFYLQVDHYAPHGDNHYHAVSSCPAKSPEPAAGKFAAYASAEPPKGRGFNERDMSDKPLWAQGLKPITVATRQWLHARYRCALASVRTTDSQIGKLLSAVEDAGLDKETVIVFWSDNGFLAGEHRMVGKARPYEQAVRVPFVIRAPAEVTGGKPPSRVYEPVANIDLAPTILRYARAEPCISNADCRLIDGRRLNGLLAGGTAGWPEPRLLVVEKNRGDDGALTEPPPLDDLPINVLEDLQNGELPNLDTGEIADETEPGDDKVPNGSACVFAGIWTPVFTYSLYTKVWDRARRCIDTRQVEIYNTREDPYQLRALSPLLELKARKALGGETPSGALARLASCAGTARSLPNPCD